MGTGPIAIERANLIKERTGQASFTTLENLPPSPFSGWDPNVDVFTSGSQKHLGWITPGTDRDTFFSAVTEDLSKVSTPSLPAAVAHLQEEGGFLNPNDQDQIPASTMDSPLKLQKDGRLVANTCPRMWEKGQDPRKLYAVLISGAPDNDMQKVSFMRSLDNLKQSLQETYFLPSSQIHPLESPSPIKLRALLRKLNPQLKEQDANLLVAYAGHGATDESYMAPNKAEGDAIGALRTGKEWMTEEQIARTFRQAVPGSAKILFMAQACTSGALTALQKPFRTIRQFAKIKL